MEDFYHRYLRLCKECLVSPMECVLSQLQSQTEDDERILDLSSYNFAPDDCNALAKTLSHDNYFKEVRFTDCLLSEDASKILLYGLLRSRSLETIDLKGNNLRCSGADAVGLFLKKNMSVRCLRLDWNSLGLWGTGIGALAEGLAVNQTVVLLDLRNNQISHDGATQLASSLKTNRSLKALDLRWNNAGLLGGRAFLTALQYNKSLTSLELQDRRLVYYANCPLLMTVFQNGRKEKIIPGIADKNDAGNNVPQDILKAITVAVKLNSERESARNQEKAKTEKMLRTIEKIEFENTMQVSILQDKLEEQTKVNDDLTKSSQSKIKHLKESLDENKTSFHEMSKELQSTKNELLMRDERISTLDDFVNDLKNQLSGEKAKCKELESEVQRLKDNESKLEFNVGEMKKKEAELKRVVTELENDIEKLNIEHKSKIKEIEAKREELAAHSKGEHASEVKYLQSNFKDKESLMKSKIESLEKEKLDAEEKISRLKSEMMSDRLKAEEDVLNIKTQHKHEQLLSSKQYEERVSALQTSRDEQHAQMSKYLNQIAELQKELNMKEKDLSELREKKDIVTKEMNRKENDYATEISRLKIDLESEKRTHDNLRQKISSLELSISEDGRKHNNMIDAKDREIESLKERLQASETDLKRQREDEIRRADLLESAIFTYVNSTRSSRAPSPSK